MAAENNTHPMAGFSNILSFFKGNFLFAILSFFVLLGSILPPRARKRRYGNHRRSNPVKRRKSGNRSRGRKRKKLPRAVGRISGQTRTDLSYGTPKERKKIKSYNKSKKRSGPVRVMPARFKDAKKGTPLMDEKMKWLRSKR